jgi:CRISPR system Cascade subunit CasA
MTSDTPAFNLLDEPWVKVRLMSGDVAELSLLEVFDSAVEIRTLAGEIPTQDIAILRLLEAVILGATKPDRPRSDDESVDLWESWWRAGSLPVAEIHSYLNSYRERFYLLHAEAPFMQVAGLHTASGNASGLVKLIADVPDGHQYFTTRSGREIESLSLAEAARWLVHCHAFDSAGIKTGAVGDSRVKGGKGYSIGYPAFAGNLGIVIAEGADLFETMMLNLPLLLSGRPPDLPIWERAPLTAAASKDHPLPVGPADAFTWPSRRVVLHESGGRVVNVQISNGDLLGPQNQASNEPMAAWRHSANQTKKAGKDVVMPVLHSPERRIWQGLAGLLITAEGGSSRAPVLDWLAALRNEEALASATSIQLRTVGIEYGPQASSIAGVVDDSIEACVLALTDEVLVRSAVDAAARASHGVVALVNLASNLAQASGGESARPRERTFELGYSLLDGPFREWLARLDDPLTSAERVEEWGGIARRILRDAGSRLIDEAGPAALVGREVPKLGSDSKQQMDAAVAEILFRAALNKALVSGPTQALDVAS